MNIAVKITLAIEIGINVITNFALNALCAWLLNMNAAFVATNPVSVFIDICITSLFVCLCTTPFAAMASKRYGKSGILNEWTPKIKLLTHYPKKIVLLALALALSLMIPLGILSGIGFSVLGVPALSVCGFILYKGIVGGIIGGLVCAFTLARYRLS